MQSNVISLAKYKKEKNRKKLNALEKTGLAINAYMILSLIGGFAVLIPIRSSFHIFSIFISAIVLLFVISQMFKVTNKIKKNDYYSEPLYFPIFATITTSLIICAIMLYYALIKEPVHLKPYLYLIMFLGFLNINLIGQYLRKEKYYH